MMASMDMLPDGALAYVLAHHIYEHEVTALGEVLVRFIRRNLNDHGYVSVDAGVLVLDGEIELTHDEKALLASIVERIGSEQ